MTLLKIERMKVSIVSGPNILNLMHCSVYFIVAIFIVTCHLETHHILTIFLGGQAVNKTANCVILKHIPTGIQVKCK